jgi:hypothetical protein
MKGKLQVEKACQGCPSCRQEYDTTEPCVQRKFYGVELVNNEKVLSQVNE